MAKGQTVQAAQLLSLTHPTAEETTLVAMRASVEDAIYMADTLMADDYSDPRRRVLFQAIVNLLRGIEPIDPPAILAECRNVASELKADVRIDAAYLDGLQGDVLRARAYANTVKRMSWLRRAGDFALWLVKELQDYPDPDELFTAAQEHMQHLQPKTSERLFVYGWETVQNHQRTIEQRVKDSTAGRVNPYTWPWMSWEMVRPLRAGMVGVLAAPDGMGKTTYLEKVAEHWAQQGLNVVYVHLEDELEYKLDRRLARWARVPIDAIEDGKLTPEMRGKVREAQDRIDTECTTLHYYHAPGLTMTEIVRELESKVKEGVCQAVVFDYLDKVQASTAQARLFGANHWERQAADVEALKVFAERNHVPVLTASQGNKAMQGTGIQTRANIAGSGGKTQKAQLVVILTRDIVGDGGLKDERGELIAAAGEYSPFVNVRIDKQNRGKTGVTIQQFLIGQFFDVRDVKRGQA